MKIKQNKHAKKAIVVAVAIALLTGGSAFAYHQLSQNSNSTKSSPSSSKSTQTASNTNDLASNTTTPTAESNKSTTNTDPQATTSADAATGKTVVSVVSSVSVSNGVVYIRGGINNVVDTSGTCYALLKSPSGTSIREDTTLLQNAATTDCKTIQVKTSELTPGTWSYTLNYSSTTEEGASSEGTFNIQ